MKPQSGSSTEGSSLDSRSTDTSTQFFFDTWVVGVFFGGEWHQVKPGSFNEAVHTDRGEMSVFEDPFNEEIVFVLGEILAYRVKKPPPPEPKASVTPIHRK